MAIKRYKPTTPGRRSSSVVVNKKLSKKRPPKSLLKPIKKTGGRNQSGRITVRHKGGGHKRFYRLIDFKRTRYDQEAKVLSIDYDPNRSANIALIQYEDGKKSYIIAPVGLKENDTVMSSRNKIDIKPGNRLPLEKIPVGVMLYNIELMPGSGASIARSAGNTVSLMSMEGKNAQLKLPSGEVRIFRNTCMATIGTVSNTDFKNLRWGKAGRKRWLGIRPTVRGKAMNPVDHPHGGGEGRAPIGLKHPKTPWGKPALGVRTRRLRQSDRLIIKRRKK
ncbi:50S ribosomal protein L2 [Patescibacteria group bacterium]|nr:50S ribosomal protein L2 [Patescibacteria group bacterium]MBU1890334.1 50S ribosomal protein L2 [Patescibacteria group bacterium]